MSVVDSNPLATAVQPCIESSVETTTRGADGIGHADHGSTLNLEALADELIAQRRLRTPFEKSTYTGLRSRFQVIARKYSACDYVKCNGSFVRKLSAREIAEFRRGVQVCLDARRAR